MTLRNRVLINLVCGFLLSSFLMPISVAAQHRGSSDGIRRAQRDKHEEHYEESALRRFEIVTLISLPFTAIHSFLAVRGVEMVRQNEIAPELSNTHFGVIGASAVSFALFIGFWDWLHTHDKDSSEQLIPSVPVPQQPPKKAEKGTWNVDKSSRVVLPIVQIRF